MNKIRRGRRPIKGITERQRRTLHEQVNQLVREGYLKREPRKARDITIARESEGNTDSLKTKNHKMTSNLKREYDLPPICRTRMA